MPVVHVLPIDDTRDHVESSSCWCRPFVSREQETEEVVVVHNSADGRELIEQHGIN